MPITVNQRPSTLISGNTSRWNAVKNPIVYKMVRKDFAWFNLTSTGSSQIRILYTGNLTTLTTAQGGPVVVGSKLWLVSDDGVYNKLVTVAAISFSTGTTTVDMEANSYQGVGASSGYINLQQRTSYYLNVGIYNAANTLLQSLKVFSAKDGNILLDVAGILQNVISVDNVADYVAGFTTNDETTAYVKFYIKYTEVWTNSAESETNDSANQFFALYGARQIGDPYGGNMAEYVNYENGTPLALFLTEFTRPVIWRGYPFSIHAITSDNQTTTSNFRIEYFDVTGTTISSVAVTKASNAGKLLRLSPNNALAIPANAFSMTVRYEKTGITVLSQTLTCDIKDPCANPIMLWWRNSLGGDAFWLFDVNQTYSYRYDNGRKAKRYTLFADNLTLNQWDAINELNTLGEIYEPAFTELTTSVNKSQARVGSQVYIMDATGKKTGVVVIPTEFATSTKKKKNRLQITIELPEIF